MDRLLERTVQSQREQCKSLVEGRNCSHRSGVDIPLSLLHNTHLPCRSILCAAIFVSLGSSKFAKMEGKRTCSRTTQAHFTYCLSWGERATEVACLRRDGGGTQLSHASIAGRAEVAVAVARLAACYFICTISVSSAAVTCSSIQLVSRAYVVGLIRRKTTHQHQNSTIRPRILPDPVRMDHKCHPLAQQ